MKLKCIFKYIGDVLIVLLIIFSTIITVHTLITNKDGIPNIKGYSPFSIQSNSMYPALKKGDLIITNSNISFKKLKKDDIISFYAYENGANYINTHRIIEVINDNGVMFVKTKGDNNDIEDSILLTEIDYLGHVEKRIPLIGGIIDFLKNKWVFFFFILIPLFILFISQLAEFIKLLIEYKMDYDEE